MSIEAAWDAYQNNCACGEDSSVFKNHCAHYLSNALIKAGFSDLNGGIGERFRIASNGYCVCKSGRPVRAKELRNNFFVKWTRHTQPQQGYNLVYQEKNGQGHVLIKNYKDGASDYRGTLDCDSWPVQEYYYTS